MRRTDVILGLAAFFTLALAMPLALFEPVQAHPCAVAAPACAEAA